MLTNKILIDALKRVKEVVHQTTEGLTDAQLAFRPNNKANNIGWLIWHLTRVQDNHISDITKNKQVWQNGWSQKFDLALNEGDTGYGHIGDQVAKVKTNAKLLLGYYDAVHLETVKFIRSLKESDYSKVVDKRWDPPVTMAVRLVSILSDDLQHAGQAAYVKGLLIKERKL